MSDISELATLIPADRVIGLTLVDGVILAGRAQVLSGGWLRLIGNADDRLINLAHVVMIDLNRGRLDQGPSGVDEALPRPRSKDTPVKVGSKVPARPWTDGDLKALADAMLDGGQDAELAERFHRTRSQVRDLRQGFECNRGNLVEDQISPAAVAWIHRWRRVLSGG